MQAGASRYSDYSWTSMNPVVSSVNVAFRHGHYAVAAAVFFCAFATRAFARAAIRFCRTFGETALRALAFAPPDFLPGFARYSAQRLRWAAAILSRAAALRTRRARKGVGMDPVPRVLPSCLRSSSTLTTIWPC